MLTTHYMEEADLLCDRVAIMDHGRILALDTPAELKRSVGAASVVKVSADSDDLEGLAEFLVAKVDGASTSRIVDGNVLLTATGMGLLPRIIDAAEEHGSTVTDLSVREPTLETVFINLTGKDLRE